MPDIVNEGDEKVSKETEAGEEAMMKEEGTMNETMDDIEDSDMSVKEEESGTAG